MWWQACSRSRAGGRRSSDCSRETGSSGAGRCARQPRGDVGSCLSFKLAAEPVAPAVRFPYAQREARERRTPKSKIAMVTYLPPAPGLPFLAVAVFPDGDVAATPYPTLADAERHVWEAHRKRRSFFVKATMPKVHVERSAPPMRSAWP